MYWIQSARADFRLVSRPSSRLRSEVKKKIVAVTGVDPCYARHFDCAIPPLAISNAFLHSDLSPPRSAGAGSWVDHTLRITNLAARADFAALSDISPTASSSAL